jgi:hypothetical protein
LKEPNLACLSEERLRRLRDIKFNDIASHQIVAGSEEKFGEQSRDVIARCIQQIAKRALGEG